MFWKRRPAGGYLSKAKKLPKSVQEYMRHRFIMVSEYLDTLRCFEYDGSIGGREVTSIRIFSPDAAKEQGLSISNKAELNQHPEMLLFEGHIDKQGSVYLADRRPPLKMAKARESSFMHQEAGGAVSHSGKQ